MAAKGTTRCVLILQNFKAKFTKDLQIRCSQKMSEKLLHLVIYELFMLLAVFLIVQ